MLITSWLNSLFVRLRAEPFRRPRRRLRTSRTRNQARLLQSCEVLEVRQLLSGPTSILGELSGKVAINGSLSAPTEIDNYTFTLRHDSEVYFDSLTNNSKFNWSLSGPAGNAVSGRSFTASDGNAISNPVLSLLAGDYTLAVSGVGLTTGAYSFRLIDLGTAIPLTVNADTSGTLPGGDLTKAYQFAANAGDSFSFSSVATTSAAGDIWRVVDPYGDVLASQSLAANLGTLTFAATGNYSLLVEGNISNTSDATFTVHATFLGNTPPVVSGTPLTLGTTVSGTLATAGQHDAYTFTLASKSLLYFDSLTNNANLNWSLSGPGGSAVSGRTFTNSDGSGVSNPVLNLPAGTYILTVAGAGSATGAYSFRLSDLAAAPAITPGTAVSGTLAGGIATNLYQFSATAGQSFYFANHVTSGSGSNDWRLVDPYGNIVLTSTLNSDPGRLTLSSTGRYVILAEGAIGNTSAINYTLNAIPDVDPAPTPLTLGSIVAANLNAPGERDAYTFTLTSSALLYFDSLTNSPNLNWSLSGPEGSMVPALNFNSSDGSNVSNPVLNLVAGTYTVTVAGTTATTGAYSFRLSDLATVQALTPGTAVNGTLAGGISTDLYQFTATAGQSFYIANHVTSGNGGNDWRLIDPFGSIISLPGTTLNTDPGHITLASTGKYTILAEGAITNTAALSYALNVVPNVDPAPQALKLGSVVAANLNAAGERDTYTFALAANALLYFDSLTNSNNFNWSLSGPAGSAVSGRAFNVSDGSNVANTVLNLVAGTYTLTVAGTGATTGAYSFRLSDLAAAQALTPGTAVNGTLIAGITTDLYQFTATAGQSFYFANHITSGSGSNDWQLVDPYGNIVSPGNSTLNTDPGRLTLNSTGRYVILAEGAIGNTADLGYFLNVIPEADPAAKALALGNTVSGNLTLPGEQDTYTFTLAAKSLLYFDSLTNSNNFNWSLSGPAGNAVSARNFNVSDASNITNPVLNLVAGTYTLTVVGAGSTTGAYKFRLFDLGAAGALTVGADVSGTLAGGNSTNAYKLAATAGDSYSFASVTTNGAGNDDWVLVDPYGDIVASHDLSGNLGTVTVAATGNYTLMVEGAITNTSDATYTIHASFLGNTPPVVTGTPLTLGTTINGTLATSSQTDIYHFNLASDSRLYFDALTNNGSFVWSLSGPVGNAISSRQFIASDGLTNTTPVMSLPAGNYKLTVASTGGATGTYSFRLLDLAAAPALTLGTAVSGTLAGGISTDLYQFTATTGQSFYIANQVTSGSGGQNDRVRLVDPFGNIVPATVFSRLDTDGGRLTLSSAGKYTVLVEGYIGNPGDLSYTLNLIPEVDPAPQALALGTLINGNLTVPGKLDTYTFTLTTNARLYFDALTNNFNFNWSLSGPAGNAVSSQSFAQSDGLTNGNPVLNLVAGTYTLTVAGRGPATGAYSFRLSDLSKVPALTLGTPVSGTLAGGISTDLYQFAATAGQSVYIADLATSGSGGQNDRVRLVDPFGNIVPTTLNSRFDTDIGRLTLNSTGSYAVLVEGYIGSSGDLSYTLNVIPDVDPAPLPLGLGTTVNGNLSFSGKHDTYTFALPSNAHLYFDALTDNPNFIWSLSGPAGTAISGQPFTASDGLSNPTPVLNLVAGNYTLTVASTLGATGAYSFRLSDLATAPALTFGTAVSGTLAGGISTDLYQFTATAGEAFYFANQVTSGTGASNDRIRLVDPFGNIVPATLFSRPDIDIGRLTLSSTGKYTLLVEGYIRSPGDLSYTLNVIRDVDPPLTHFALSGLKDSTPATTVNALEGNSTGTVVLATFIAANPLAALADFTLTVDWGGALIGTPTASVQLVSRTDDVSNWQVVGSAIYAEKGLYTVTPTVTQPDGTNVKTSQIKFNVADAPLTDTTPVTVFHSIENSGTGDTILATFTDADPSAPLADFTPAVNWGGALVGTPTVSVQLVSRTASVSNWKVVGNATYAEEGNDTVTVNVNDADGSTMQTTNSSFLVADAALTDTTPTATLNAVEGNSTGSVVLATFTDADAAAPLSDFTPTVDWGGTLIGTPTVAVQLVSRTASVSNWQVVGTATYAEKGNFTVTVTTNDVGGSKVQTTNTHFSAADATLTDTTLTTTLSAVEGNSTGSVILATFSDGDPSAPLADFTPTVNWVGTVIGTPTVAVQLVSRTSTVSNWQVVGSAVYAEKGNFTPTVTVNDADGSSVQTNKTSFNVADAPLTDTTPTATLSAVEGNSTGSVVLATFRDGDPSAPLGDFTPSVNWVGTVIGTPTVAVQLVSRTSTVSNWQVVSSAVYAEKGNFTPTVTVNDADGSSVQTSKTSVNVADAPLTDTTPTTTLSAVQRSSTGSVVLATFSDGDPSAPPADFTPTVNWGGTPVGTPSVAVQLVSRTSAFSNWQVVGTATYAASGIFTVSVTVNDVDGSSMSTNKTSFSVTNAALTNTTPVQTFNATEGSSTGSVTLATFSDADAAAPLADFSATANWGGTLIGTPLVAVQLVSRTTTASNWQVVGSATYAEAGTLIPTVTVNDSDGDSFQSTNTHFNVADAALIDTTPTTTLSTIEGNITGSAILATFSDGDPSAPLTDFTPNVNWVGTVIGTPTVAVQFVSRTSTVSNWQVVGSAVYAEKGNFTPTVTVNDADGSGVQTSKTSFRVADAPLTDTTPTATLSAVEGNSTGSVVLATFTDGDPSAPLADFTPTVNWVGTLIGTPTVAVHLVSRTSTVSNWQVVGSAVYGEKGNFTPTVTVNDADGSSVQASKTSFNVADAPLTDTTLASTINAVAGTSTGTVVLATFTDGDPAAPLSDFTPSVNWGGTLVGPPTVAVQLVSRTSSFSTWQVTGSATYAAKGMYIAAVTVNDVDGATLHTSQTQFSVSDAAQQLLSYSIQHGETERSFIRFIDLSFSTTAGLAGFLNGQGIRLTFYDANGLHPTTVSLANEITVRGTHVTIDFGPNGIGGNRLTSAGDGTYRLALDLAGDGSFSTVVQFFRLFGDVNGDGTVDASDVSAFIADRNLGDINGDVNGDGQIDTRDLAAIKIAMGHTIKPPAAPGVIGSMNTASKTHHSA